MSQTQVQTTQSPSPSSVDTASQSQRQAQGQPRAHLTPAVDVREAADRYEARFALPGVREADIDIRFEPGLITLTAPMEAGDPAGKALYREWQPGVFVRSLRLSDDVDGIAIRASLKNGILTVTLPKRESAKVRKIPVSGA